MASTSSLLNFPFAAKIAGALAPAGPRRAPAEQRQVVESIRYAAVASVDHVHKITGLSAAYDLHDSEVLVVDRSSWARANAQSFSILLNTAADSTTDKKLRGLSPTHRTLVSYAGGGELGGILAYLSTRVLGQYDPYAALAGHGATGGRLMLVAPNILEVEEELNVDPQDFRLWVCLHEQTHRVQFAAAGWLREYLLDLIHEMVEAMGGNEKLLERAIAAAGSAKNSKQPPSSSNTGRGAAIDLVLDDRAREVLSRITSVMSLLEGHANVVMDAVDSSIVPTVKTIRRRFNRRSETQKFTTRFISKLLGMDRKLRQYKDGQKFVQYIVDAEGMARFNAVWESPQNLPTEAELHNPQAWIQRVLGGVSGVEN